MKRRSAAGEPPRGCEGVYADLLARRGLLRSAYAKGAFDLPHLASSYASGGEGGVLSIAHLDSAIPLDANDRECSIPFIVSTIDEDRDGDVVVPLGCQTANYRLNPVWFFGHQSEPIPIAKGVDSQGNLHVFPEERKIRARAFFDKADPDAMFLYGKVKRGFLGATSIAFVPLEAHRRDRGGPYSHKAPQARAAAAPPGWVFERYDLTEISIVGLPANAGAIRDSLDREKSFISPRLRKGLERYAASPALWWGGWSGEEAVPEQVTKGSGQPCKPGERSDETGCQRNERYASMRAGKPVAAGGAKKPAGKKPKPGGKKKPKDRSRVKPLDAKREEARRNAKRRRDQGKMNPYEKKPEAKDMNSAVGAEGGHTVPPGGPKDELTKCDECQGGGSCAGCGGEGETKKSLGGCKTCGGSGSCRGCGGMGEVSKGFPEDEDADEDEATDQPGEEAEDAGADEAESGDEEIEADESPEGHRDDADMEEGDGLEQLEDDQDGEDEDATDPDEDIDGEIDADDATHEPDSNTPFVLKPGMKALAQLHRHAKSEHDFVRDELIPSLDHPGVVKGLAGYLAKMVLPRLEHLMAEHGRHYSEHHFDRSLQALEAEEGLADGNHSGAVGEENAIEKGDVPEEDLDLGEGGDLDLDDSGAVSSDVPPEGGAEAEQVEGAPDEQEVSMGGESTTGPSTREILERYQHPKTLRWHTRKAGTLRVAKSGKVFLVRQEKGLDCEDDGRPHDPEFSMKKSKIVDGSDKKPFDGEHKSRVAEMQKEIEKAEQFMDGMDEMEGMPSKHVAPARQHSKALYGVRKNLDFTLSRSKSLWEASDKKPHDAEHKGVAEGARSGDDGHGHCHSGDMGVVKAAEEFMDEVSKDLDTPGAHRKKAYQHSKALHGVHRGLDNMGKVQKDGGSGSTLTDEGTMGNKGSMTDMGKIQADSDAHPGTHEKELDGEIAKTWENIRRKFQHATGVTIDQIGN